MLSLTIMQIVRVNKFLFLLFIAFTSVVQAQTGTSSPYSRYGIGDLQSFSHARNAGMGGLSFAVREDSVIPDFVNFNNPASYTAIKFTSFDAGISGTYANLKNSRNNETVTNASVQYFAFGFPVTKWWGGCFGLKPYSSIGYGMSDSSSIADTISDTQITVTNSFSGKGGLNQFFIGSAVQPFKNSVLRFRSSEKYKTLIAENDSGQIEKIERRLRAASGLSFGVNSSFLFGTLDRDRRLEFNNSSYYDFKQTNSSDLGGFYFNLGLQYSFTFRNNTSLVLGAVFTPSMNIKGSQTTLTERYQRIETADGGYDNIKDTIKYEKSNPGSVTLPMSFGGGVVYKKAGKWQFGVDYLQQNWSSYQAFGETDALSDSRRISGGAEFGIGKDKALSKGKIMLRIGGYYTQTFLQLKNTQLNDYGISLGVGFPIARRSSMINMAFEIGERGTTANDLIKEQYVNLRLGFTFNDKWFLKRKYD
ncbi:MAG: hypothetical protein POELPBGB_02313 [Bacteroidia bacterium]|nr:hypothetical protein [Bacteroidia bacterium]